jgi:UDP-N-acetylglucosamine--N-acetylmuramyl-(pentapeptide) pyrophosphoryl-undecaprenol N-acetylglucosamine transferase
MNPRVLITGGGTVGTFTPLLAVVASLKITRPDIEWLFVGTPDGPEGSLAEAAGIPFRSIPAGKLRRYWSLKNITDIRNIFQGYQAAKKIVRDWKPQVVVSAGSYVSVPVVWAAKSAGCRVVIHQQDISPGLANRLMIRAADKITISFKQSSSVFPADKTIVTGNPVRKEILEGSAATAQKVFGLNPTLPTLVVLGGSTGSQFLNNLVGTTGYRLVEHWQILHITGNRRDYIALEDERYHRYDFLTWEMPHALAVADVVLTRAGLGTLSELAALARACIFIPMPSTHQEANARMLEDIKAGIVLDQRKLEPAEFVALMDRLREQPAERERLGHNLHQLYQPTAVDEIGKIITSFLP